MEQRVPHPVTDSRSAQPKKCSNRPKIPRVPLSQLISFLLRHALGEMVVVTPQLLLVVPLEVEVHEREDS